MQTPFPSTPLDWHKLAGVAGEAPASGREGSRRYGKIPTSPRTVSYRGHQPGSWSVE